VPQGPWSAGWSPLENLVLRRAQVSADRLRVDILPSDTTSFVNSLNNVSAWPGARCALVHGGICHDFGMRTSMANVT
jgi:hypothetical protein